MLTYSIILIQIISIIAIAYILRYARMFRWKQSWVTSFGLISITYIMFKTSMTLNMQLTLPEWLVISFINAIGWHMCFYCKEEKSILGVVIMFITPAVVLGPMF